MAHQYNALFAVMQEYGIERTYELYTSNALIPARMINSLRNRTPSPQADDLLPQPTLKHPMYAPVFDAIADYRQLGSFLSIVGMYQQLVEEINLITHPVNMGALTRKLQERNRLQQSIEIMAQYLDYIHGERK